MRTALPSVSQRPTGGKEIRVRSGAGRRNWASGPIKAGKSDPWVAGAVGAGEPLDSQNVFFLSPPCLNGSLRLFPPPLLGLNRMFQCPSGPGPALRGTLARLPGKAPDVMAERDPSSLPSPISLSPARALLTPSPTGFQTGEK